MAISKRVLDLLTACLGLLILAPIMAVVAGWIRLTMGAPVMFRQVRAGRRSRLFTLFKFRTMREAYDSAGKRLSDTARLTSVGQFLRKTSLDELPQLWNVLKGDMALVGPRPLLPHYLPRYTAFERRRHEVRPGITGWAQVSGRNEISWERKFELDVWYADHWSLWLDLKIVWLTIDKVLQRKGINQPGDKAMPEFRPDFCTEGAAAGTAEAHRQ